MSRVASLFANDETAVDSVIASTLLAMLGLLMFEGWKVWHDPAAFSPMTFSTAAAAVIGAGGGIKTCRERYSK